VATVAAECHAAIFRKLLIKDSGVEFCGALWRMLLRELGDGMPFASIAGRYNHLGAAMSSYLRFVTLVAVMCAAACRPTPEAPGASDDALPAQSDAKPAAAQEPRPGAESTPAQPAVAQETAVKTAGASHPYLIDNASNALYFLEGNQNGEKCDAACQEVWPPVTASGGRTSAGEGARAEMLKTSPLSGGRYHLSYNGHPLYRYAGDRGAGRTTGHEVEDKWGKWHLMSVEGRAYEGELPSQ
jgi:predicted lipoprotein with Yx(FWY)xxD motif